VRRRFVECAMQGCAVSQVDRRSAHVAAKRRQFFDCRFQCLAVGVEERHARAVVAHGFRTGEPDATRSAGDRRSEARNVEQLCDLHSIPSAQRKTGAP
jgi:hypothetical protein